MSWGYHGRAGLTPGAVCPHLNEVWPLLSASFALDGVLLGTRRFLLSKRLVTVRQTKHRPELGNLLIVAPTRSGKGLLAVSQLLTWHHSVIVNDIKGDLFTQTAGFRSLLGPVYVLDPTGVGHRYDPLNGKATEDALLCQRRAATPPSRGTRPDIYPACNDDAGVYFCRSETGRGSSPAVCPYDASGRSERMCGAIAELSLRELATIFLDVSLENANLTDRFLLSAWGTLTARMRPLLTETVVRSLAHSDFTAEQIITQSEAGDRVPALERARPARPVATRPAPMGQPDR